jgi:hypothetical protein
MDDKWKFVRRFNVKSEIGKNYTVLEYIFVHTLRTGNETVSEVEGLKKWITTTGLSLNETREDPKTFHIVETSEIVREV